MAAHLPVHSDGKRGVAASVLAVHGPHPFTDVGEVEAWVKVPGMCAALVAQVVTPGVKVRARARARARARIWASD